MTFFSSHSQHSPRFFQKIRVIHSISYKKSLRNLDPVGLIVADHCLGCSGHDQLFSGWVAFKTNINFSHFFTSKCFKKKTRSRVQILVFIFYVQYTRVEKTRQDQRKKHRFFAEYCRFRQFFCGNCRLSLFVVIVCI